MMLIKTVLQEFWPLMADVERCGETSESPIIEHSNERQSAIGLIWWLEMGLGKINLGEELNPLNWSRRLQVIRH